METQKSTFNRTLLIALVVLYLITIAAFSGFIWTVDPQEMQGWMKLLNLLILSIPLVLVYGSIYLLVVAWREHAGGRPIEPHLAKIIHWAPRVAAILIIFFVGLFSLDVFGNPEATLIEELGAFIMHSLPSIAMLVLLILAWKRPAVGFWAFLAAAALLAVISMRGEIYALTNLLLFVLPALLVAGLFYIDWKWVGKAGVRGAA